MRVLGIDPGTASLGFGVVEAAGGRLRALEHGVVRTSPEEAVQERLLKIHAQLRDVVERWRPRLLAVEQVFFRKNVTSALSVGQARGVVLLLAAQAGLEVAEYPPHAVKMAVSGVGRADKAQVQEMVRLLLSLPAAPQPDDAADALAVAICGAHHALNPLARAGWRP
ncbi:MAG: crossover junction endodeoxyribonuclease RuvC [Firmicutes bacterium]|nr:crossover junction endodeoxyribonuclease RuvC [Bacillota bacterium]